MWKPRPSAVRLKPIIIKKPRHSMITVGWLLTKRVSGLLSTIMMPMEKITAIIITDKCSTIPTAVITASSENTASSTTICATIGQNAA
ncbi:hypothetical protein D3C72_1415000 [compost metagenome]